MNRKNLKLVSKALTVGLIVSLTACNNSDKHESPLFQKTPEPAPVSEETKPVAETLSVTDQVEFATRHLAERLGIETNSVSVVAVRHVQWRSGALGCPEPGMNYTQALVPGILILLTAGEENFGYHAKDDGKPFYCPAEKVEKPVFIQSEDLA